jgi:hypothetical protein
VKDKRWKSFGCEDEFAWEAFCGNFGGEIQKRKNSERVCGVGRRVLEVDKIAEIESITQLLLNIIHEVNKLSCSPSRPPTFPSNITSPALTFIVIAFTTNPT